MDHLMTLASGALSTTAYGYDAASRLQTVNDGNNNTATYSYVANSPLVKGSVLEIDIFPIYLRVFRVFRG